MPNLPTRSPETLTLRKADGSTHEVEVHGLAGIMKPRRPTSPRAPKCTPANIVKLANAFRGWIAEEIAEGNDVASVTSAEAAELLLECYEGTFHHPVNASAVHCAGLVKMTEELVVHYAGLSRRLTVADLEACYTDPTFARRSLSR
jgi:hypothetical protein